MLVESEAECAELRSGNHRLFYCWGGCQFDILDGGISSLPAGRMRRRPRVSRRLLITLLIGEREKLPMCTLLLRLNPPSKSSSSSLVAQSFSCQVNAVIRNVLADRNFKYEGTFWMLNIYHLISAAVPFSYYAFSQGPSGCPQRRGGDVLMLEIFLIRPPLSEVH